MRSGKKNINGTTLLEAILAITIAGSILAVGLRVYQSLSYDSAAQKLRGNVEQVIRGAAMYYYANCQSMTGAGLTPGTLDPSQSPSSPYTAVTVSNLVSSGYLMKAPPANPLVNNSAANGGYAVQFIRNTSDRYYCNSPGSCDKIGINYNWTIQVSVQLTNASTASRYLKMSGADCITSGNGITMASCNNTSFSATCQGLRNTPPSWGSYAANQTTANNMGCPPLGGTYNNYLAWERLPSMASPKGQSQLWLSNPTIKQFKQGSTSPSLLDMLANPNSTYFLCGS